MTLSPAKMNIHLILRKHVANVETKESSVFSVGSALIVMIPYVVPFSINSTLLLCRLYATLLRLDNTGAWVAEVFPL